MMQTAIHILALDSATSVCSVALLSIRENHHYIYTRQHSGSSGHAQAVLPMMQAVLDEARVSRPQLTAVAFGQGPGAFTGLRVACGVAQGLAYALNIPVIPVGSLHAMAQAGSGDEALRVVVQDARMHEVYAAAYKVTQNGACLPLCDPVLLGVADFPLWLTQQVREQRGQEGNAKSILMLGNAGENYPELRDLYKPDTPLRWQAGASAQATTIAQLGWQLWQQGKTLVPAQAAPLYVRDKVAYTTAERQSGQGGNPRTTPLEQAATSHITSMQVDDLDAVLEIERRTQMYPWTRGQIEDSLHADCEGWVIRQGSGGTTQSGQVCGFYLLMKAPDVAHLLLLGVAPEYQRQGLGHQLLSHCETRTAQLGLPAVLLEVRPSNHKAVAFYTNRNFARIGVRKDYYPEGRSAREDAWVMQKRVQVQT